MITSRLQLTGPTAATLATMLAVVALLLSSLSLQAQGGNADSASPELVLVDLRIADAVSSTLQGQRIRDSVLLPAREVCLLAELPCEHVTEKYVSLDSIAALLHSHVDLDWTQLAVLVTGCDALPVVRRYARAAARDSLLAHRRPTPNRPDDFIARSRTGFSPVVRLQYAMTAASSSLSAATHALSLGTAAFRGSLTVQFALSRSQASPSALRRVINEASWIRTWRRSGHVRQLRLGDVAVSGGAGMLRGASLTNASYDGSGGIDSVLVTGATGPGREVEAYRDGTLVAAGYATADGTYSLWLPSIYGANRFTVASYGLSDRPHYTHRAILIEPGMLSAGSFRYAITAGRCRDHLCRGAGDLDVSYAPVDRLTASASINTVKRDNHGASFDFDARMLARVTNVLSASVARTSVRVAANAAERNEHSEISTTAHFVPTSTVDVLGTYRYGTFARTDAPLESRLRQISRTNAGLAVSWQPRRQGLQPSLTAQLTTLSSETRSSTAVRLGLGLPLRIAYMAPFARYTHLCDGAFERQIISLGTDALISPTRAPSVIRRSLLRLTVETGSSSAVRTATAAISVPLLRALRLDTQATWAGARRPTVSLSLRQSIGGLRITNTVSRSAAGKALALHTLDGSVLIDARRRRIATGPAAVLGGASISGTVFIDLNRNDRFDPGEQPVPGAYVRAGDGGALSDSTGEYELRNVEPYAPVVIQLDPLTLPGESLTPLHRTIRAETVPDESLRLDIAIVEDPLTTPATFTALNNPR